MSMRSESLGGEAMNDPSRQLAPNGVIRGGVRALRKIVAFLPTLLRLLVGGLLMMSGWTWLTRPDPVAYVADAVNTAIDGGQFGAFGFYQPFLRAVVVPNFAVFATLLGWGELLSGISIGFGLATRVGAGVIIFHFVNYGLLGGPIGLLAHGILIALVAIPVFFNSSRRFGIDRWLHARWPNARIW